MTRKFISCAVLWAYLLIAVPAFADIATNPADKSQRPSRIISLAVLPFDCEEPGLRELASKVDALLIGFLSARPEFLVAEREAVAAALDGKVVDSMSALAPSEVEALERGAGARIVVTGRIFSIENEVMMVARLEDAEHHSVFGESERMIRGQSPGAVVERLAGRISAMVATHELYFGEADEEAIMSEVRKAVAGRTLPNVKLAVQHGLVKQELRRLLREAGFELNGEKAPGVVISGEISTEHGFRKGDLISKKGRVFVRAEGGGPEGINYSDQQTEIGIEADEKLAEEVALRRATLKLFARLAIVIAR